MTYPISTTRLVKAGHTWVWREADSCIQGHYKSTSGNLVMVFPPNDQSDSWHVVVEDDETHDFVGDNAEERAFAAAETYTRQQRS